MREDRWKEALDEIRSDRTHGARDLAVMAVHLLRECVETSTSEPPRVLEEIRKRARELSSVRPSMSSLLYASARYLRALEDLARREGDVSSFKAAGGLAASEEIARIKEATERAATLAASSIPRGSAVITHSFSETVLETLRLSSQKRISLICCESRPLFEGRETARRASSLGISVTLITEAQIGIFLPQATVALVGADAILTDGSIVNKVGTLLLASLARQKDIPFYVVCQSDKIHLGSDEPAIEEKEAQEVSPPIPGVEIRNIYFEKVPPNLISALFTEEGRFPGEDIAPWVKHIREKLLESVLF